MITCGLGEAVARLPAPAAPAPAAPAPPVEETPPPAAPEAVPSPVETPVAAAVAVQPEVAVAVVEEPPPPEVDPAPLQVRRRLGGRLGAITGAAIGLVTLVALTPWLAPRADTLGEEGPFSPSLMVAPNRAGDRVGVALSAHTGWFCRCSPPPRWGGTVPG